MGEDQAVNKPEAPTNDEMRLLAEKLRHVLAQREYEVIRYMASHRNHGTPI